MTPRQLYEQACYLVYEQPDDDDELKDAFPHILNSLLAICVPHENMFRASKMQDRMLYPALYTTADDTTEIPFVDEITRVALPFGVQSKFLEADDDKKAEAVLAYNKFIDALTALTPAVETEEANE